MRIAVLSSGGKDSSAAWWWAMCRGWEVAAVVTVDVQDGDSHMFQVPSTQWVQQQAEIADLPWINVPAFGSVEDEIGVLNYPWHNLKSTHLLVEPCAQIFRNNDWNACANGLEFIPTRLYGIKHQSIIYRV